MARHLMAVVLFEAISVLVELSATFPPLEPAETGVKYVPTEHKNDRLDRDPCPARRD